MQHDLLTVTGVSCGVSYWDQPSAPEDWICASGKMEKFRSRCVPELLYNYCLWAAASCYGDLRYCFDRRDSAEVVLCDCVAGFSGGGGVIVGSVERTDYSENGCGDCVNLLGSDYF